MSDAPAVAQRVADQLLRDARQVPLVSADLRRAEFEASLAATGLLRDPTEGLSAAMGLGRLALENNEPDVALDHLDEIELEHHVGHLAGQTFEQHILAVAHHRTHPLAHQAVVHGVGEFVGETCVAQIETDREVDTHRLSDLALVRQCTHDGHHSQVVDEDAIHGDLLGQKITLST